ncbi:hypothetical protein TD95_002210 [Thielaviopsis punctulata]|uniref:Nudix hydrolase domain-containing protein n=1 Tax=Thielaviopsis punctulata TaxID=72032 RepID=A0A0F4ZJI2_9PEZI|nr:hypothetical protein TD95_002210 [Thielaviopsis punctulata]
MSASSSLSMESRVGRTNQRYNENGERLVAGVVPLSEDRNYVLLIQSTRRKTWVLPKGGWELDEQCADAAQREAWEEAGIIIKIDYDLGDIAETRAPKESSKTKQKSVYRFYEATVVREEPIWPEHEKRERAWMKFSDAFAAMDGRPELQEALCKSTINRL